MLHHCVIKHLVVNAPQLFNKNSKKGNKYDEINKSGKGSTVLFVVYNAQCCKFVQQETLPRGYGQDCKYRKYQFLSR